MKREARERLVRFIWTVISAAILIVLSLTAPARADIALEEV
jgi:hypothetical protein